MPPGLPHAVFTVGMEGYKPTSVMMAGSHFLSEYTMSLMLDAAISHSAWHDVWTNATHDCIVAHVDWMLHNLLLRSENGIPSRILQNGNAFALIAYARFALWLGSPPHQRHVENPAWLKDFSPLGELKSRMEENRSTRAATRRMLDILGRLSRKADECVSSFIPADLRAFKAVWKASREKLEAELQRRHKYNMDTFGNK